jgi:checkpoint serine/threonine-protein kinase
VYEAIVNEFLASGKVDSNVQDTLTIVLEEATRHFADSLQYQRDHRYLRLWMLYASLVDNSRVIFEFLMKKAIAAENAIFYQEYAAVLELADLCVSHFCTNLKPTFYARRTKAEEIYKLGISKKAHPLILLKQRFSEHQSRIRSKFQTSHTIAALSQTSLICQTRQQVMGKDVNLAMWAAAAMSSKDDNTLGASNSQISKTSNRSDTPTSDASMRASPSLDSIRRNPLRRHLSPTPPPTAPSTSTKQAGSFANECRFDFDSRLPNGKRHPYAHLLNQTSSSASGSSKRPERLMFELSDLLSPSGVESSFEEIRLRKMGLLNKRWTLAEEPPAVAASSDESVQTDDEQGPEERIAVKFNDQDENQGPTRRKPSASRQMTFEPTVTLNTKAALNDVYGMFNSPEKTRKLSAAMIKEVSTQESRPSSSLSMHAVTPGSKSSQRHQRTLIDSSSEIEVFQDEEAAPVHGKCFSKCCNKISHKEVDENAGISRTPKSTFVPFADDTEPSPASVFKPSANSGARTPFGLARPKTPGSPTGGKEMASPLKTHSRESSSSEPQPENVFSLPQRPEAFRPVSRSGRVVSTGSDDLRVDQDDVFNVFQPETDPAPQPQPAVRNRDMPIYGTPSLQNNLLHKEEEPAASSKAISTFTPFTDEEEAPVFETPANNNKPSLSAARGQAPLSFLDQDPALEYEYVEEYEAELDDEDAYRRPQAGRCGAFNVMTPITERTCEFTTSTRAFSTPSERYEAYGVDRDAPENVILDKTEMLSLSDSVSAASRFKPPNPCNPFDPAILSTLLSFLPEEKGHHEMKNVKSNHLQTIQKFVNVEKKRGSGGFSRSTSMGQTMLDVLLGNSIFQVVDKLGEGGFGAVFRVREVPDGDTTFDEDREEDEFLFAALKIVHPRNVWEFYVLRDLIRNLPPSLRISVIEARALYTFESESVMVLDCEWGTLLELVNKASQARVAQHGGSGLSEVLVIFFARELLRIVEGMHRVGFIHGDMKIDNCLLRLHEDPDETASWESKFDPSGHGGWNHKGIRLIDFGRTISTRIFPQGQQFIGDWPTDARDCIELQENRPWTYQTDYFGLAGIFYCMLYGKYLETKIVDGRVHIAQPLKRYWQVDIWSRVFDVLLNSSTVYEDGLLPISDVLREIRLEMEDWLVENSTRQQLKGLLKKAAILKDQE